MLGMVTLEYDTHLSAILVVEGKIVLSSIG